MQNKHIITTLLTTAAIGAMAAPAAHADSFAYVKSGDVWLTTTDGARQFQVTSGGGVSHVSQADDGTLLATVGGDLERLDRYGNVLSDIRTPVSTSGTPLFTFYGPYDADLSPDGKTIAYGWWQKGIFQNGSVMDYEEHNGTGFSKSDTLTGFTDTGYKYFKSWDGPEWIDDQTVLVANGPGAFADPFAIATLGTGDPKSWFYDPDNMHPLEPTMSRNKRVLAAVVGPDAKGITVYRNWTASLFGTVSACFTYSSDGHDGPATMTSPTFNADGSKLAYSDGHDLLIAPIGDMTKDCAPGVNSTDVIAGATSPDWGPADVPTSRPTPTPAPGNQNGGHTSPGQVNNAQNGTTIPGNGGNGGNGRSDVPITGLPNPNAGGQQLAVDAPKNGKSPLKKGVTFVVHGAQGKAQIKVTAGKTKVTTKSVSIGTSGLTSVTLKLSAAVAKKYRASHGLTLQVVATQGAATAKASFRI